MNTHRQIRPSTTDPGTLTARANSQNDSTPRRISSASPSPRNRVTSRTCTSTTSNDTKAKSKIHNIKGTGRPHSSTSTLSYSISPRLEEISRSPSYRIRKKVFGKTHTIHYDGRPPRLAYHVEDHAPHPAILQKLPKREDHPELPTNTPTIEMHRPKALSSMRSQRQKKLVAAAQRGEPHAVRKLAEQKEQNRIRIRKEKQRRALRRSIMMATLDRFSSKKNIKAIRNRAKDGSGGIRLTAKALQDKQKQRLNKRSFIYQEWDEYRDHHELSTADAVTGKDTRKLRTEMDRHDEYVEEHAVLWTPRSAKAVLAEERLVKDLLKTADSKMKKHFKNYKPAVSHGDTKKIIRIKRAGNRYLEGLTLQRETSQEDAESTRLSLKSIDFEDPDPDLLAKLMKGVEI
jgi:hypothetical protein